MTRKRSIVVAVGQRLGIWEILSDPVYRAGTNPIVSVQCTACNKRVYRDLYQLTRKSTANKGCKACSKMRDPIIAGTRVCTKCSQRKNLIDDFHARSDRPGKRQSWCKSCDRNIHLVGRRARKHAYRTWSRMYADKKKYGYPDIFASLLVAQDGKCAVCQDEYDPNILPRFAVDHCHENFTIRGILCHTCNHFVGYLQKYRHLIQAGLAYLDNNASIEIPDGAVHARPLGRTGDGN